MVHSAGVQRHSALALFNRFRMYIKVSRILGCIEGIVTHLFGLGLQGLRAIDAVPHQLD